MKSFLYRAHRWIGLFACLPILVWTLSGISHPIMSWLSPEPVEKMFPQASVADADLAVDLKTALTKNILPKFRSAAVVSFNDRSYYQVKTDDDSPLTYFDTQTGELLPEGDKVYAEVLARHFVGDTRSKVISFERVKNFDGEYREIFQFLPAWKVQFDRADGMRAYVDTTGGRLATLVDSTRSSLLWFFRIFHNWELPFLNSTGRVALLLGFAAFVTFGGLSGLIVYGLFWKKLGNGVQAKTARGRTRRFHRTSGLIFSGVLLLFAASGAFHAVYDLLPDPHAQLTNADEVQVADINVSLAQGLAQVSERGRPRHVSLASFAGGPHYLIFFAGREAPAAPVAINATTGNIVEEGDLEFGRHLARQVSSNEGWELASAERLTQFKGEYSPVNKRLPVVRVEFAVPNKRRLYVDPQAGVVAMAMDNTRMWEKLSFRMIHKWHLLDLFGASKNGRDIVAVTFAGGCTLVTMLGMVLLLMNARPGRRQGASMVPRPADEALPVTTDNRNFQD